MKRVGFSSHLLPPEWIEAHGLQAVRVTPRGTPRGAAAVEGLCPYVAGLLHELETGRASLDAFVFVTSCDQMRRAPSLLRGDPPHFLFNAPATWQADAARRLHRAELTRFGAFLEGLGGTPPTDDALWAAMQRADEIRAAATAGKRAPSLSDRRILLTGGPLTREDRALYGMVEAAGGRVIADLAETGPGMAPPPFGSPAGRDPFKVLCATWFDGVPSVHHRPGDRLVEHVRAAAVRTAAEGLLVVHHTWCDLWRGAAARLREACGLPLLLLELGEGAGKWPRERTRIEAFLETLR